MQLATWDSAATTVAPAGPWVLMTSLSLMDAVSVPHLSPCSSQNQNHSLCLSGAAAGRTIPAELGPKA